MITFGGPQCIVDKSIKKIIAEVRPLFCWRCQHFGNKRSSNPSLRVLRIRKGKFLVKNCSLAHIASVHNCLLCCQHLFEFLGFPRLGSLGFPPLSGLPGLPGLPTPSISAGLPKWAGLPLLPTCFLEAMGAQLILGAQQILMVLGAQGAREPRTMKCTKARPPITRVGQEQATRKIR